MAPSSQARSVHLEHRDWLRQVIGEHSNEPRLVQRLREVHDQMPPKVRALLGDRQKFARAMADTRNYFTHFSQALKPRALTRIDELFGTVQQLSAILKMLFVKTLGLDHDHLLGHTVWGNHILQRLQSAARYLAHTKASPY